MLARPGDKVDLRGTLVASTYPLYPSNQWMTTPYRDGPRVFFANRGSQGLYNATVAHLWEMGADEPKEPGASTPQLLEFGLPYDITSKDFHKPPIWISVVGERGIYPVKFVPTKDPSDYLYHPETHLEGRAIAPWLPIDGDPKQVAAARTAAARAAKASPHLLFWLMCLFMLVACLIVAAITVRYVEWSSDPKKYERNPNARMFGFGHILRWFNCDVAERGPLQLRLIHKDTDIPAKPANRNGLIAVKKVGGDFQFQVFNGAGKKVNDYNESTLAALTAQGGARADGWRGQKWLGWLFHPVRRCQLSFLRKKLGRLWQTSPAIQDAKTAFSTSLTEKIETHFASVGNAGSKETLAASLSKNFDDHPAPFSSTEVESEFVRSVGESIDHHISPIPGADAKKAFIDSLFESIDERLPAPPSPENQAEIVDSLIKIAGDRLAPFAYVDPKDDTALAEKPYNPQSGFADPQKNRYRPPAGAGLNIAILNLVVAWVSSYLFIHVILGTYPVDYYDDWPIVPFTLMTIALATILASTVISLFECFRKFPGGDATQGQAEQGERAAPR